MFVQHNNHPCELINITLIGLGDLSELVFAASFIISVISLILSFTGTVRFQGWGIVVISGLAWQRYAVF